MVTDEGLLERGRKSPATMKGQAGQTGTWSALWVALGELKMPAAEQPCPLLLEAAFGNG